MAIWRVPFADADARHAGLTEGFVGMGYPVDALGDTATLAEYEVAARPVYATDRRWSWYVDRLGRKMQKDDLCFTVLNGVYWIGRVDGPWHYVCSFEERGIDLANVRPCEWHPLGTEEASPREVVVAFSHAGGAIQRIHGIEPLSRRPFNRVADRPHFRVPEGPARHDPLSALLPGDLEDVVLLYIQTRGYACIPSTRRATTPEYEAVLIHMNSGSRALVQVKSGDETLSALDYQHLARRGLTIFLFAQSGEYPGASVSGVETLAPSVIRTFMTENPHLIPQRVRDRLGVL